MALFGGALKKFTGDLKASAAKFTNLDFLQGVIAASLWVAYADGELEAVEKTKMLKGIQMNENLKHFSANDVIRIFNDGSTKFDFDVDIGIDWAKKEIREAVAKSDEAGTMIYLVAKSIARADGEIDGEEKAVLAEIAKMVGYDE